MTAKEKALAILEELDLFLLRDLYCPPDCAQCQVEEDHTGKPCYYVGWPQELAAGITGGASAIEGNLFEDEDAAHKWVIGNEEALRQENRPLSPEALDKLQADMLAPDPEVN